MSIVPMLKLWLVRICLNIDISLPLLISFFFYFLKQTDQKIQYHTTTTTIVIIYWALTMCQIPTLKPSEQSYEIAILWYFYFHPRFTDKET